MGNRLFTLCPADIYDGDDFDEVYEVDEVTIIGSGKFSTVHPCWRRDDPGTRYALKNVNTGVGDFAGIARVKEEIEILQLLGNHPGIVTLIDVDESMQDCMRIVMELCEGGELYDAIQAKKCYNEPDSKATVRNLLETVAFIHSKGIMHRDMKPENILLVSKAQYTDVKISDFGLAKMSRDYPRRLPRSHSICGSDFYLAPEVIKQEEYGREIDIWAVGVIAYVLLSGALPFFHQVLHKLYRQIVERDVSFPEEAWRNVSKGALDFILRLLQVRADDRLTAEQALGHPWLRGQSSGSSFGSSFTELANLTGAREATGTDLTKVLSKSTTNAHPLEHAHKVNLPGSSAVTSRVGSTPFGTVGMGSGHLMRPMPGAPAANFGALPMQSRAQPMVFR
jgi:calcium/calmodulin-dependent protein kinase I